MIIGSVIDFAGAHTAQPLAALPLTDAACPLRVLCARPSPVRRVSIERAHGVRPYGGFYRGDPVDGHGAPGRRALRVRIAHGRVRRM